MFYKIGKALNDLKRNLHNHKKLDGLYASVSHDYKSPKVNIGQLQAAANAAKKNISSLAEVEFQVFSQFGDDGIIQWLVHQIPFPNKTFIEFGVENYKEANTRFLLVNNGWSGFVMDGSEENMNALKFEPIYAFFDIQAVASFITKENINELLSAPGFKKETGILSIDIDGNDYWVWDAIDTIEPVVIICEYNSLFGFSHPYSIPYDAAFVRGKKYTFSYYGISLLSAYTLAAERGYSFIGCNTAGNNAYFIKNEYMQHIGIKAVSPEQGYVFQKYTEVYDHEKKDMLRGSDKVKVLEGLPVYNTVSKQAEKVNTAAIIEDITRPNKLTRP